MFVKRLLPSVLALLAAAGCQQEPPKEATPEAPPPPTAQEVYADLRRSIDILWMPLGNNKHIKNEEKNAAVVAFRTSLQSHQQNPNLPEAKTRIQSDVERLIKDADAEDKTRVTKGAIEVFKTLQPGSDRYAKLEQRVDLILARPEVQVRGFLDSEGDTYAFVDVIETDTQKKTAYQIREGEEFHKVLRMVRIIGNNQAVELEYIPINQLWQVKGPREKHYVRDIATSN